MLLGTAGVMVGQVGRGGGREGGREEGREVGREDKRLE